MYFGSEEAQSPTTPQIRSNLEFDDQGVENISKLVFKGMKGCHNKTGVVSKHEIKTWTKQIMSKKYPNREFDESMFEEGFKRLDVNKDGTISLEDIVLIVRNKCKREGLYAGDK